MMDTFDGDLFNLFYTVIVPVLVAIFVFLLLLIFISRPKKPQSYDGLKGEEYDMKGLHREKKREMKKQRREAKRSSELPGTSQVIYAKSAQSAWVRLSNTLKALVGSKLSKGTSEAETETEPQHARDDRRVEAGRQTSDIILEAGGSADVQRELAEVRISIAKLVKQNDSYQEVFSDGLREIRLLLERLLRQGTTHHASESLAGQRATHQGSYSRTQHAESRSSQQTESTFERLCRLYNASMRDQSRQQEFKEQYGYVRIGATNYMECARDPSLNLEFGQDSNGYFEAIKAEDGRYVVVPRFNLVIQDTQYGAGAVGKVFHCRNYVPGNTYRHIELIRPAIFATDGENWEIDVPGELHLS